MKMRLTSHSVGAIWSPVRLALIACFVLLPIARQLCAGQAAGGGIGERSSVKLKPVVYLNLREYLAKITAESPKIVASRLDAAAAYYRARSTYAGYFPNLSFDSRVGHIQGKRLQGFLGGFNNLPTANRNLWFTAEGPGLTIPIFRDGSFLGINVPPEAAQKRAETQIVKFKGSLTEQSVILSGTDTYLQAIKATHVLEFATRHFTVAQEEAARVENRATSALATAEELGVARLLLASSRASFEAAQGEAIYSFLAVAALLGRDAGTVRIQDSYPEAAPLPDFEKIAGISSVQHPKVRIQEAEVRGARANVALQRSRLLPSVTADSFDYQLGDFHGDAANDWVSVLTVHVPVFDFGEAYLATKSARTKLQAEIERRAAVEQDLRKELVDAMVNIKQAAGSFAKAGGEVVEAQRVATRLEEQAKLDQALLGELNMAKLKFFEKKEDLEQAQYELLHRYALYQETTGGQWKWIAP
ncbi:MAG TPA: TolC family protein [Candidatus Udaeobacter sp.]|jgi:outer membrane protein TolC